MRWLRNCTPPFTNPSVPVSLYSRVSRKFRYDCAVARNSFCGFPAADPPVMVPSSTRHVAPPSQPAKVFPSNKGTGAADAAAVSRRVGRNRKKRGTGIPLQRSTPCRFVCEIREVIPAAVRPPILPSGTGSMMPPGFESALTPQQLADLLQWIRQTK